MKMKIKINMILLLKLVQLNYKLIKKLKNTLMIYKIEIIFKMKKLKKKFL